MDCKYEKIHKINGSPPNDLVGLMGNGLLTNNPYSGHGSLLMNMGGQDHLMMNNEPQNFRNQF